MICHCLRSSILFQMLNISSQLTDFFNLPQGKIWKKGFFLVTIIEYVSIILGPIVGETVIETDLLSNRE